MEYLMAIQIEAFANSDDVFVAWRSDKPISDCVGFELRRTRNGKGEIVNNRITFDGDKVDASKQAPSDKSPIRRYAWADHEPNRGEKGSYQVVPVIQKGNGSPQADEQQKSPPSAE